MDLLNNPTRLVIYSFLVLFAELALIRWLGSNILFLSYFSNFILLGSFLGIGVGFLQSKSSDFYRWAPILLVLLMLFVSAFPVHITYSGSGLNSLLIIGKYKKTGLPIWITLPVIFLAVTAVMASLAHGTAIVFSRFKPLIAYRLDIAGALLGISVFSALSYMSASPIVWGIIVCVAFALLFWDEWKARTAFAYLQIAALFILIAILSQESSGQGQFWSPYYKISLHHVKDMVNGDYIDAFVNGVPHQRIQSLERRKITEPFYFLPYENRLDKTAPENILIIGAGTGGDTAIALKHGAKHIDAVEIDPVLYQLGRQLNSDHPYDNQKVNVIVDDGRAFLEKTSNQYDMIILALTDSLTLISGQSSLRLESYLFTKEALTAAKNHLKPNGILALYNYYLQPWYIDRLATTLQTVFHQTPCVNAFGAKYDWRAVLTISNNPSALQCQTRWSSLTNQSVAPSSDNHPFIYLQHNRIPILYIVTLLLIFAVTLAIMRFTTGTFTAIKSHLDLFFMGMAFLLLETKSIATFALLFGTTWVVNAMVFAGILLMVYLAIEVTNHFSRLPQFLLYGLLLLSLFAGWMLPEHFLFSLPVGMRYIIATLFIFSPIFLANLLFTTNFQNVEKSTAAFGVNMIGAMIGGLLEYVALVTGYRFLLILIAVFYTLALIIVMKTREINNQPMTLS